MNEMNPVEISVYNTDMIFRRYYRLNIKDFCEKYGLNQSTGGRYFNDRQLPVELAVKIAEDYKISLDYIYRFKLTEEILRKVDPSYMKEQPTRDTVETIQAEKEAGFSKEQQMEVLALTSKDPFKDAMKILLKEILEEKEKEEKSSKAS